MFSRSLLSSPRSLCETPDSACACDHVPLTGFLSLSKPGMLLPQQGAHHEMFNMNNFNNFIRSLEVQVAFSVEKNQHWKQLEKHRMRLIVTSTSVFAYSTPFENTFLSFFYSCIQF